LDNGFSGKMIQTFDLLRRVQKNVFTIPLIGLNAFNFIDASKKPTIVSKMD